VCVCVHGSSDGSLVTAQLVTARYVSDRTVETINKIAEISTLLTSTLSQVR